MDAILVSKSGTPRPVAVDPAPAVPESPSGFPAGRLVSPPFGQETAVCPRCKQESSPPVDFCSRCGFSFLETRSIDALPVPAPAPLEGSLVGQVINGKYRVLSILGEGGFGVVYKVELLLFDSANLFALKLLHPALSQDRSFRRRFLREAGLAMALIHENTIQIRELGQTEDGQLFFTMDYSAGEPLKCVIAREGYLNVNRALHVTRQILSVMKLAHARGIIHRDLKPENIFLENDSGGRDFVKVGDFGLAKSFGSGEDASQQKRRGAWGTGPNEDITRGAILGTPRYMSPEQALGKDDLDDRSDLYSIGVVLHEMLYGKVPGERAGGETNGLELRTPVPDHGHAVPAPVWEVVRKSLEVQRENRFQSADEFLEAIDSLPRYTHAYEAPGAARSRAPRRVSFAGTLAVCLLGCALIAVVLHERGYLEIRFPFGKDRPQASRVAFPAAFLDAQGPAAPPRDGSGSDALAFAQAQGGAQVQGGGQRLPSMLRDGLKAYLRFQKGDILKYLCFRNGIADREIVYHIVDEPVPGVFTVSVSPGDRTFSWILDEKENAFYQEFSLPDPDTGALTETERKLRLRLPPADTFPDRSFTDGELRMKFEPEDLLLPQDPKLKFEKFAGCLRVESREDGRIRFHYFQAGRGFVGIEVYESRENAVVPADGRKPPLFARYLVESARANEAVGTGN